MHFLASSWNSSLPLCLSLIVWTHEYTTWLLITGAGTLPWSRSWGKISLHMRNHTSNQPIVITLEWCLTSRAYLNAYVRNIRGYACVCIYIYACSRNGTWIVNCAVFETISKQFSRCWPRSGCREVYYFLIRRIIDLIEERKKRGVSFVGDILGQNFEESRRSGNWNELEWLILIIEK